MLLNVIFFRYSGVLIDQAYSRNFLGWVCKSHDNDFLYLDPPYANGGALYGVGGDMHKDFQHATLADMLKKRQGWLLSYNDCQLIRDLYSGYKMTTPEWTYGMNSNKKSKELLIFSSDLPNPSID